MRVELRELARLFGDESGLLQPCSQEMIGDFLAGLAHEQVEPESVKRVQRARVRERREARQQCLRDARHFERPLFARTDAQPVPCAE